ncbi:MAG: 4Fe-4S dicluster domain-containing protein, partial [Bacteroidales bacterium]|nr:4Fe-4S dicluster domain-containing protein [Bacteroidales bacterium]
MRKLKSVRSLQVKPVFIHDKCIGCKECIKICSQNALAMHPVKKNWVVLTDKKCIRCFCCSEVCQSNAIQV